MLKLTDNVLNAIHLDKIMITDLDKTQNNIPELDKLEKYRYENIFKVGRNNNYYFYNILKTITFPENLNKDIFYYETITSRRPLTTISYNIYGNQDLWWLIVLTNKITNPIETIAPGTALKIIKPEFVDKIITSIRRKNNV